MGNAWHLSIPQVKDVKRNWSFHQRVFVTTLWPGGGVGGVCVCVCVCARQYVVFKSLTYCWEETIGSDVKTFCKASSVASHQTRWCYKRILREGCLVSRGFSWIEHYKLNIRQQMFLHKQGLFGSHEIKSSSKVEWTFEVHPTHQTLNYSKLTIGAPEKGVEHVHS